MNGEAGKGDMPRPYSISLTEYEHKYNKINWNKPINKMLKVKVLNESKASESGLNPNWTYFVESSTDSHVFVRNNEGKLVQLSINEVQMEGSRKPILG